jgi:hypothetical protein
VQVRVLFLWGSRQGNGLRGVPKPAIIEEWDLWVFRIFLTLLAPKCNCCSSRHISTRVFTYTFGVSSLFFIFILAFVAIAHHISCYWWLVFKGDWVVQIISMSYCWVGIWPYMNCLIRGWFNRSVGCETCGLLLYKKARSLPSYSELIPSSFINKKYSELIKTKISCCIWINILGAYSMRKEHGRTWKVINDWSDDCG